MATQTWSLDLAGLPLGTDLDTVEGSLGVITQPAAFIVRAPDPDAPPAVEAVEQEVLASGYIQRTITATGVLGTSMLYSCRSWPASNAALLSAMSLATGANSPSFTVWLQTDGTLRFRDQTTGDTSWAEKMPLGQWVRIDTLVDLTGGTKQVWGRFWSDIVGAPESYQEITATLTINPDTEIDRLRWGLNVAQASLNGSQWRDVSLWDGWPDLPTTEVPKAGKVWTGLEWVDNLAVKVRKDGAWVDPTEALYWDGSGWHPVG
jgi:hypothetical protein